MSSQMLQFQEGEIQVQLPISHVKSFTEEIPSRFKGQNLEAGFYVWGYASITDVEDSEGDEIENSAMSKAIQTLTKKPYNKVFLVHNYQKIAVGKILYTEMDGDKPIILAKLNQNLSDFNEIWGSIQEEYLDSFSIGGSFTKVVQEWSDSLNRYKNIVKELILREVSLTSIPAHPGASVKGAFQKMLGATNKNSEEKNMVENKDQKNATTPQGDGQEGNASTNDNANAQKSDANIDVFKSSVDELTKKYDTLQSEVSEIKTLIQKMSELKDDKAKKSVDGEGDAEGDAQADSGADAGSDEDNDQGSAEGDSADGQAQAGQEARKSKKTETQKFQKSQSNNDGKSEFMNWLAN